MKPLDVITRRHNQKQPWTYGQLDALQREVADRVRNGGPGALILSEVAPIITVGRRTPSSDLPRAPSGSVVETLQVSRGGLATYHGPGQWVAFAVDRLENLVDDPRGVRKMVCALLAAAAEVGRLYRQDVRVGEGEELGVWSAQGKFAAVGIHISDGIVQHGLSLNGFRTETSFRGLRPCGLDRPVDYLLEPLATEERLVQLGELLRSALLRQFSNEGQQLPRVSQPA